MKYRYEPLDRLHRILRWGAGEDVVLTAEQAAYADRVIPGLDGRSCLVPIEEPAAAPSQPPAAEPAPERPAPVGPPPAPTPTPAAPPRRGRRGR